MENLNLALLQKLSDLKFKVGKLSKDLTNPFFNSKYFDINQLLEQVEPIAHDLGLLILQPLKKNEVSTIIFDIESGQSIESSIELQSFSDPQKAGSAITYYRRYTLQSLLGLQAEDDDANKASGKTTEKQTIDSWMSAKQFEQAKSSSEMAKKALAFYDGKTEHDGKVYGMKKEYRIELEKL